MKRLAAFLVSLTTLWVFAVAYVAVLRPATFINPLTQENNKMNDDRFWQIIASAGGNAVAVTATLSTLTAEEIEEWSRIYWEKHNALHRWVVWDAAYVIAGGCGDDGFHYFKAFAIGKGKAFYEALAADPDSVGPLLTDADAENMYDNEMLNYAATQAYESVVTGSELEYTSNEASAPEGEQTDEDDMPAKFPKLWAQFGEE